MCRNSVSLGNKIYKQISLYGIKRGVDWHLWHLQLQVLLQVLQTADQVLHVLGLIGHFVGHHLSPLLSLSLS